MGLLGNLVAGTNNLKLQYAAQSLKIKLTGGAGVSLATLKSATIYAQMDGSGSEPVIDLGLIWNYLTLNTPHEGTIKLTELADNMEFEGELYLSMDGSLPYNDKAYLNISIVLPTDVTGTIYAIQSPKIVNGYNRYQLSSLTGSGTEKVISLQDIQTIGIPTTTVSQVRFQWPSEGGNMTIHPIEEVKQMAVDANEICVLRRILTTGMYGVIPGYTDEIIPLEIPMVGTAWLTTSASDVTVYTKTEKLFNKIFSNQ